jgi:hypothetical protein
VGDVTAYEIYFIERFGGHDEFKAVSVVAEIENRHRHFLLDQGPHNPRADTPHSASHKITIV